VILRVLSSLLLALIPGDASGTLADADRLFQTGRYEQAADAYFALLRQSPRDPKLLDSMGHTVWKMGRPDAAARFFSEEVAVSPANREAQRSLGAVLQEANMFEQGRALLETLTRSEPGVAMNWYRLGLLWYQNGYYPAAIQALDRALELTIPEKNNAELVRAMCLLQGGRAAEAAREIPRLLAMPENARNLDLLLSHVQLLVEQGNYKDALNRDTEALQVDRTNANAHFWRARILLQENQLAEAVKEAEQARDLSPNSPSPRNLLVRLYRKAGRAEDADREAAWLRRAEAAANGRQSNGPGR
jgi:tetratricopeptide (TPR) repeat protein